MAHGGLVRGLTHGLEDRAQRLDALQAAQPGGVGAGDVDDEVVDPPGHRLGRVAVVLNRVLKGRHLGLADIRADDDGASPRGAAQSAQPLGGLVRSGVVEAHAVAHGAHLRVAPHTGLVVTALGTGGEGPDLDEAEAEHVQALDGLSLLVHAGCEPQDAGHGAGEGTALVGRGDGEDGSASPHLAHHVPDEGDLARQLDGVHAYVVDQLGIDAGQDGLVQQVVEHGARLPRHGWHGSATALGPSSPAPGGPCFASGAVSR